jgi:hypothetical protein
LRLTFMRFFELFLFRSRFKLRVILLQKCTIVKEQVGEVPLRPLSKQHKFVP